ncbi:hypothetical protein [Kordia sp.]|uniref:hypothetical protein n=1 Tax=Kordia sp. TaxID=1965332 RepID=UPI003B5981C1
MKKIIQISFVLFLSMCVISCSFGQKKKEKAANPENELFLVDNTFCKEKNVPIIEFSVEYPKHMTIFPAEPSELPNPNYAVIGKYRNSSTILEAVQIEAIYVSDTERKKVDKQKTLRNIMKGYRNFFNTFTGETDVFEVNGKKYAMMRGKIDGRFHATNAGTLTGKYLMQSVVVMKDEYTGIVLTMLADQEKTDIKTYDDFFSKGDIGEIWKTLEMY